MQVGNRNYRGLLKFGIKEHMEALYEEGLLYLNTFTYFKELEYNGDGRADIYEGVTEYYSGEGFDNLNLTISFERKNIFFLEQMVHWVWLLQIDLLNFRIYIA